MTIKELLLEPRDKHFSVRAYNMLRRSGFRTVDDIVWTTFTNIQKCPRIGYKTIEFLIQRLHDHGYVPMWETAWAEWNTTPIINVGLDVETYNLLCAYAEDKERSFAKIIRDLLEEKMKKERDV